MFLELYIYIYNRSAQFVCLNHHNVESSCDGDSTPNGASLNPPTNFITSEYENNICGYFRFQKIRKYGSLPVSHHDLKMQFASTINGIYLWFHLPNENETSTEISFKKWIVFRFLAAINLEVWKMRHKLSVEHKRLKIFNTAWMICHPSSLQFSSEY